jgi:hypothetical protein
MESIAKPAIYIDKTTIYLKKYISLTALNIEAGFVSKSW